MKSVDVINGPNINLLGMSEREMYGESTLNEINGLIKFSIQEKFKDIKLSFFQSNSEGEIVDYVHSLGSMSDLIVINPAGLSYFGVVMIDAIKGIGKPFIEVHISNVYSSESFSSSSLFSSYANGVVIGFGYYGYEMAIEYGISMLIGNNSKNMN